jgi:hypothetical protein
MYFALPFPTGTTFSITQGWGGTPIGVASSKVCLILYISLFCSFFVFALPFELSFIFLSFYLSFVILFSFVLGCFEWHKLLL